MTNENIPELQFEANLLFRDDKNAMEAFNQLIRFYEVLTDFDRLLVRNISPTLASEYVLQDVKFGSLKTRLAQVLKGIPDELLKDVEVTKIIGFFLVKFKYKLIRLLSEEREIVSKDQIQKLTDQVNKDLREIGEKQEIIVTQVNNYFILNAVDDLVLQINSLNDKELFEYKSTAGNTFIQKGIYLNKPKILAELGQRTIINETTELLKIKKIDMLSVVPKWDFLQGKKLIKAKVLDQDWLDSFHKREVSIRPEDALMVTLKTTHTYNPNFDDKKTEHEVVKVRSVVSPEDNNAVQLTLGHAQ
ncbi:MAG: hypothetical protein ABWZ25_11720 [Chitinophagaceae bacterium]